MIENSWITGRCKSCSVKFTPEPSQLDRIEATLKDYSLRLTTIEGKQVLARNASDRIEQKLDALHLCSDHQEWVSVMTEDEIKGLDIYQAGANQ